MASLTYKPDPGDAETITWRGIRFKAGEAVQIKDPAMFRKAQGNRFFDASGSKEEEEAAAKTARDPLAGAQVNTIVNNHPAYYETGGGASSIEGEPGEGVLENTLTGAVPPSRAVAAGGGLHGPTLGDEFTVEQVKERYGTDKPTDSLQPGEPVGSVEVTSEVQQVQREAAPKAAPAAAAAPAPAGRGRPRSA